MKKLFKGLFLPEEIEQGQNHPFQSHNDEVDTHLINEEKDSNENIKTVDLTVTPVPTRPAPKPSSIFDFSPKDQYKIPFNVLNIERCFSDLKISGKLNQDYIQTAFKNMHIVQERLDQYSGETFESAVYKGLHNSIYLLIEKGENLFALIDKEVKMEILDALDYFPSAEDETLKLLPRKVTLESLLDEFKTGQHEPMSSELEEKIEYFLKIRELVKINGYEQSEGADLYRKTAELTFELYNSRNSSIESLDAIALQEESEFVSAPSPLPQKTEPNKEGTAYVEINQTVIIPTVQEPEESTITSGEIDFD